MITEYTLEKNILGCKACSFCNLCTGDIESVEKIKKTKAKFNYELFSKCGYAHRTIRYKPIDFFLKKRF